MVKIYKKKMCSYWQDPLFFSSGGVKNVFKGTGALFFKRNFKIFEEYSLYFI